MTAIKQIHFHNADQNPLDDDTYKFLARLRAELPGIERDIREKLIEFRAAEVALLDWLKIEMQRRGIWPPKAALS